MSSKASLGYRVTPCLRGPKQQRGRENMNRKDMEWRVARGEERDKENLPELSESPMGSLQSCS